MPTTAEVFGPVGGGFAGMWGGWLWGGAVGAEVARQEGVKIAAEYAIETATGPSISTKGILLLEEAEAGIGVTAAWASGVGLVSGAAGGIAGTYAGDWAEKKFDSKPAGVAVGTLAGAGAGAVTGLIIGATIGAFGGPITAGLGAGIGAAAGAIGGFIGALLN